MEIQSNKMGRVRPVPEGEHNAEREYRMLSIVYSKDTNKSYISKKDVPAGINIDNKIYWQVFGNGKFVDNAIINVSYLEDSIIPHTLAEAISMVDKEDRRPGIVLAFYEKESNYNEGNAWILYQFKGSSIDDWDKQQYWVSVYNRENKFKGWFLNSTELVERWPNPFKGDYAYVGQSLNNSWIWRCNDDGTWSRTSERFSSNAIINYYGDINNNPDFEDIDVNEQNRLKFANREPNENEMGYVILRKDKTFAEQVTKENTIYEIRYNFVIDENITIPENCVLKFDGGSISGGNITINSYKQIIYNSKIFDNTVNLIDIDAVIADWFVDTNIDQIILQKLANSQVSVYFYKKEYNLDNVKNVLLADGTHFIGLPEQTTFNITIASGASYIFGIYESFLENFVFNISNNISCDIIRFDTSFYNNIQGKDVYLHLENLRARCLYQEPNAYDYPITFLHFLVRNFNDDLSNNNNKYNILQSPGKIQNLRSSYCEFCKIEVIQKNLVTNQSSVYFNSLVFKDIYILGNKGFTISRVNESSSFMYNFQKAVRIYNMFQQIETATANDNIKALKAIGCSVLLSNSITWDNPIPLMADNATIINDNCILEGATYNEADSIYNGAKTINNGIYTLFNSILNRSLTINYTNYNPTTAANRFVANVDDNNIDLLFGGNKNGNNINISFKDNIYKKRIKQAGGSTGYDVLVQEIDTNASSLLEYIYNPGTGEKHILNNFKKYDLPIIVTLSNNLILLRQQVSLLSLPQNSYSQCTITMAFDEGVTIPTYEVVTAMIPNVSGVTVVGAKINNNIITLDLNVTEYSTSNVPYFNVVVIIRNTFINGNLALPNNFTVNQIESSIKRKQGNTANRPTGIAVGFVYFDTSLGTSGKPIWYTGSGWVDATGQTV